MKTVILMVLRKYVENGMAYVKVLSNLHTVG